MKDEQLGIADNGQTERPVKCSLAGLLEIDCAEDARQSTHATPQRYHRRTTRPRRRSGRECEPQIAVSDGRDTSARSPAIACVALWSALPETGTSSAHDPAALLSFRTPRSRRHESWNARGERPLPGAANPFVARTAQQSWTLNCLMLPVRDRTELDRCPSRRSQPVRQRQDDASAPRSPARTRGQIPER